MDFFITHTCGKCLRIQKKEKILMFHFNCTFNILVNFEVISFILNYPLNMAAATKMRDE